ncbi:MAG: FHA domain-containing protein [Thermoleophilaceae bacterium]|nr:FHA domain-containing protein [Thermoleophilaceae bacterium]
MALHCPECGFVNPAGANYCQKCGAYLAEEASPGATTAQYDLGSTTEGEPVNPAETPAEGPSLVIRTGGRAGDSFTLDGDRFTVGRDTASDVFLDDVTVSRNHAVIVRRADGLHIDDLGSLNGSYVNRRRIESHFLVDGDELQIGKFKLTYLER